MSEFKWRMEFVASDGVLVIEGDNEEDHHCITACCNFPKERDIAIDLIKRHNEVIEKLEAEIAKLKKYEEN